MSMKRLFVILALFAAAAPPVAALAQAAGPPAQSGGRQAPLSSVLQDLARRYPGRQLNTTMGEAGGRSAYFVHWQLANGHVVIFVVDAENGQIIGRQGN